MRLRSPQESAWPEGFLRPAPERGPFLAWAPPGWSACAASAHSAPSGEAGRERARDELTRR
eukprot:2892874-Alexandrium_andersonii.AAC.1